MPTNLTPIAKYTKVTGADRAQVATDLKTRYEQGASIRTLAAELGRSYGFVHRLLEEAGTQLRGRGGSTTKGSRLPADRRALADPLAAAYATGASIQTVADEFGLSYGVVRRILKWAGCQPRPSGGNTRTPRPPDGADEPRSRTRPAPHPGTTTPAQSDTPSCD